MKCRVHIECRSAKMVECIAYVVQTDSAKEAKERALHTAGSTTRSLTNSGPTTWRNLENDAGTIQNKAR